MLRIFLISIALTALTVFVHGLGTLSAALRVSGHLRKKQHLHQIAGMDFIVIRLVCFLFIFHVIEITLWAAYYRIDNLFPDFETAVYFSSASYTTVGYGDIVLSGRERLLGPIEAVVGVLMLGWSTGVIVAALTKLFTIRFSALPKTQQEG